MSGTIGCVIIGRNEGDRLRKCLASASEADRVVYVDSGSTDGSVEAATSAGADVVDLDLSKPFTAARARNAGFERLKVDGTPDFVQYVDGDCELREGWLAAARAFLNRTPDAAVVFGRRRERFPKASVYNQLCDWEWDVPAGVVKYCGGDTLMRSQAFEAVDGFNPGLIAGEEPELCVRLRAAGWTIYCINQEMTWHDAAISRLGQWWKRARRTGHAYAEGAHIHGNPPERHNVAETKRAVLWGAALPLGLVLGALIVSPWILIGFTIYPIQILRLTKQFQPPGAIIQAVFLTLAKFPEAVGVIEFHLRRMAGRKSALIEYK